MEIIMLIGKPKNGKTATLHFVHEILVTLKAKITCFKHIGSPNQRDFSSVIEYRNKSIRIFTMGDIEDEDCKEEIQEALNDTSYDFLVCACNNENDEFIKKIKYTPFVKTVVEKEAVCQLAVNWYDANMIIALLEKSIK